jgi:dTDP-4-dehydrorhamnose reductase
MTRAVVTGASGLLGGAVVRELMRHADAVEGWSHAVEAAPDGVRFRTLDLRDASAAERVLRAARPDLVVHCAALTDVDRCESDREAAAALNAAVPGRLAATAYALGSRFVHVSTDAVYDGERAGLHDETETPRPVNAYARTKLDGERAVMAAHRAALVVRTTMHGWSAQGRVSFSEAIVRALLRGEPMSLFSDVRFSPLVVTDLAAVIRRLAEQGAAGVVNVGAADAVSKEEFGRLVAREFGLADDPIVSVRVADRGLRAPRPRNCALAVGRLTGLLGEPPPTVRDGVRRMCADADSGAAARLKGRAAGSLGALAEAAA